MPELGVVPPVLAHWNRRRECALLKQDTPDLSEDHGVRRSHSGAGKPYVLYPLFQVEQEFVDVTDDNA